MIKIYISFILPSQHIDYNEVEWSEDYSEACWRELSSISDSRATVCRSASCGSVTLYLAPYLPDVSLSTSSAGTATCSGENCRNWERFILVLVLSNDHCSDIVHCFLNCLFTLLVSTSWPSKLCNWLAVAVVTSDPSKCGYKAFLSQVICVWGRIALISPPKSSANTGNANTRENLFL